MSYLTVQDIVELHKAVSAEFGGTQASPGMVESQFGLLNAVQRPQAMTLGKEAFPTFSRKASAFLLALLQNSPFRGGNRRVALASLIAFCELNHRAIDGKVLDEKALENLIKRAASFRDLGLPQENVFHDLCDLLERAIVHSA